MITTGTKKESRVSFTICIAVFIVTFFLNGDFGIRFIYNFIFVTAFVACGLLIDRRLYFNRIVLAYFILALAVVVFSFLPNSVKDPESNNHAIAIILFFLCAAMSMPSGKELERTRKILIAAAVVFSLYIISVKVFPGVYWNRIIRMFPQKTQQNAIKLMKIESYGVPIGGSMVFADYVIAVALFLWFGRVLGENCGNRERTLFYISSALFFLAMVIENRRGELFAIVLVLFLMFLLSTGRRYIPIKKIRRMIVLFIVVVVCILVLASAGMLDRYLNTLSGLGSSSEDKLEEIGNGRMALWREALLLFRGSPVLGIGWNQFRAQNQIPGMEGINVHNDYLQWLCETGLIGFSLIFLPTLAVWTMVFRRSRQLMRKGKDASGEDKSNALASFGIQSFFMILHFFDPCFTKFLFWSIYALSIILYNVSFKDEDQTERSSYAIILH